MIPIPPQLIGPLVKAGLGLAVAAGLYGLGQWHGREAVQEDWAASIAQQQMVAGENIVRQAQNAAAIESRYQHTIDAQAKRVRALTKEVKAYAESPVKKCELSPEFVAVFDNLSSLHQPTADGVPAAADSTGAAAGVSETAVTDAEILAVHQLTTVELANLWDTYDALRDCVRSSQAIAAEGAGR